jgi:type IV pilus assembly protein PilC
LGQSVAGCRSDLEKGESFPAAVQKAGIITGIEAGILKTGFRAGSLDKAVAELARRYQSMAEGILERFTGRIEPTLIVILSVTVGLALLSVMLPLIGMLSSIGG